MRVAEIHQIAGPQAALAEPAFPFEDVPDLGKVMLVQGEPGTRRIGDRAGVGRIGIARGRMDHHAGDIAETSDLAAVGVRPGDARQAMAGRLPFRCRNWIARLAHGRSPVFTATP